jgi:hypothetical protein
VKPVLDLDFPNKKDGSTLRQHLTQLKRWDWIEEKSPKVPPGGAHLWEWFWEIVGGRGPEEGFWVCLRAWSEMTGIKPSMWEVDVLRKLNSEYMSEMSRLMKEK